MEVWDMIFKKYHDPTFFVNTAIQNGRFVEFLETFQKKHEEEQKWEFYLHKLSFMDNRSFDEFCNDLDRSKPQERPSDKELTAIVRQSYDIMKNFDPERG